MSSLDMDLPHDDPVRSDMVICLKTDNFEVSLTLNAYYRRIPDLIAESHGYIRVVDNSGDDYIYPKHYFAPCEVLPELQELYLSQHLV